MVEWRPGPPTPVLHPGVVHVWRIPLSDDSPCPPVEPIARVLSADEIARAARFHSEQLRRRFMRCRWALRTILGRYTGHSASELVFDYEAHGKPVLRANPFGSARPMPHFNLSHSDHLALVAVASESAVGVDVERVRRLSDADRVAKRFFAAGEYDRYRALDAKARQVAFFNCWTRKEAFVKALGEGFSRPLHSFEVTLDPGAPAQLVRVDRLPDEAPMWSLHGFEPASGYCAAVAARQADLVCQYFELC